MSTAPLHLQVARRQRWARRATFAGFGALAASLLALLFGASNQLHLLAIGLGALLGLLWPQRLGERGAMRWVGAQAGLAYETAWENGQQADQDPQGLLAAVRTQGRLSIRAVRLPTQTPWWVPALVLALALWLLPAVGGLPRGLAPLSGQTPASPAAGPPSGPQAPVPAEGAAVDEQRVEAPVPAAEAGGGAPSGNPGAGQGGAGSEAIDGQGGEASDRDALERFVEGLRSRPEEEATVTTQATVPVVPGGEEEGEEGDPEGEGSAQSDDPAGDGDAESGQGQQQGEGEGEEDGAEGGAGDQPQEGQAPGEDGEPQEGQGDPAQGDEQDPGGQGQQAMAGEDGMEGFDAGEGDGAGVGMGMEVETAMGLGQEGELAEPEALQGQLGVGPEQVVGGLMLPGYGEASDAFLVPEGAPAYQRAVEQALIDGDLPVSYQEVIRNYFR